MSDYSDGSMIVNTEIDTEGFKKDSEKLERAVASLSKRVESIGQQMKTAIAKNNTSAMESLNRQFSESQTQVDALRRKMEAFSHVKILSDDYIKTTKEIEKTEEALSRLMERQEKMRELGKQSIEAQKEKLRQQMEAELQAMDGWDKMAPWSKQAIRDEYMKDLEKEYAKLGKPEDTSAFKSLQYDIDKAREKLANLNAEKEKMEANDTAFQTGESTRGYEQINRQIQETEQQLAEVDKAKRRAYAAPIGAGILNFLSNVAKSALNAAVNLAKIAGNGALSYLRRLASGAKNAAIQLMKLTGSALSSGIRRLGTLTTMAGRAGKSLLGIGNSAKKSNNGLNLGLKVLMKYGLGMRSMFTLIRKVRSAIGDAFKNMAKRVPEVNRSLSLLASSLDRMKNSLATAFQPILTTVAPYLAAFMDMISNALTKVGEFFAALTGQKYVYKATKAQIDYAKSLDKTKKSAKEAKNQLAGFDDLNILSDSSKDSGSTKTETPTSSFKKIPIEDGISDLAKRIKEAFEKGDFYEIGKALAEKVYGWFNSIDWEKVGDMVGRGIMSIVTLVKGFAENFPWGEVGAKLASGLNALFDRLDFITIADTLIALIKGALAAMLGFIETFKWKDHGEKLAAGIRQFISNLPVGDLGEVLRKGIVGILQFIRPALGDKQSWASAGKKLGELLNELFKGKPGKDNIWAELKGAIVDLANGVILALKKFIMTFKWGDAGKTFGKTISDLILEVDWNMLSQDIVGAADGAITMLREFVAAFKWEETGKAFHDAILLLVEDFPLSELGQGLSDLMAGALRFMNEILGDQELFEELGGDLSDFLNTIFSNTEMWDEVGETANNMLKDVLSFGKGFLEKFEPETAADAIKTALGRIEWDDIATETWNLLKLAFQKAGSFVEALFSNGEEEGEGESLGAKIGTKLSEAINEAINSVVPWSDIGKTFNELLNNGLDFLNNFVVNFDAEGFADGVCDALEEVEWGKIANKIITLLLEAIGKFDSMLRESIYRFFGVEDKDKQLEMKVTQMAGELFAAGAYKTYQEAEAAAKEFYGVGEGLAKDAADGFTDGMDDKKDEVTDAMEDTFMDPYNEKIAGKEGFDAHSPSKTTKALGKDVMQGFAKGLESQKEDANKRSFTLFTGLFATIVSTAVAMAVFQTIITTTLDNLQEKFPEYLEKYKEQFDDGWRAISDTVRSHMESIERSISDSVRSIEAAFPQSFDSMGEAIQNKDWYSIGSNIVNGISNGINNNWPWLQNTVWNLAIDLYNTAKQALGINSPSKVFRDGVGKMLGLGVAKGMEDSQPKILDSVSTVADAMADEMKDADVVANVSAKGSSLDNVLATFSDKVESSFSKLVKRLEEIAESVTFRMPNAAAGTVVPYSVTGNAANTSAEDQSAATEEQTSALIQMFNNQTTAIVRAIEENRPDIRFGDKAIGEAAIREINRIARATGKSPIII